MESSHPSRVPGAQWVLTKQQGNPQTLVASKVRGNTGEHSSTRGRNLPAALYAGASTGEAGALELGYSPGKDQEAGHARIRPSRWLTLRWEGQAE